LWPTHVVSAQGSFSKYRCCIKDVANSSLEDIFLQIILLSLSGIIIEELSNK